MKELTQQELIRVFSSYLPYNLQIEFKRNIYPASTEIRTLDLKSFDLWLNPGKRNSFQIKPILWDLSMLTKEITHEGETFVPTRWLRDNCGEFDISKQDMETLISMFLHVFRSPFSAPYYFINKLLEWHFNIFSLDESQYINKATLKNDSK